MKSNYSTSSKQQLKDREQFSLYTTKKVMGTPSAKFKPMRPSFNANPSGTSFAKARQSANSDSMSAGISAASSSRLGARSPQPKTKAQNQLQARMQVEKEQKQYQLASKINIIEQLNNKNIISQDYELEIERLQTTCYTLTRKQELMEDKQKDFETYKRTLISNEILVKNKTQELEIIQDQNDKLQEQNYSLLDHVKFLEKENLELRRDLDQIIMNKQKLQDKMQSALDYVVQMEEKVYKSNKISLELLKQLKDAEVDLESLKQYMSDRELNGQLYLPARGDPIDKRLAIHLSSHPKPLQLVNFERVAEGTYNFGSKKVNLKLDNDQLKVRVGGGYATIDDFLDQNLKAEEDKYLLDNKGNESSRQQRGRQKSPNSRVSPVQFVNKKDFQRHQKLDQLGSYQDVDQDNMDNDF